KPLSGTAKGGKETAEGVQVTVGKPLTTGRKFRFESVSVAYTVVISRKFIVFFPFVKFTLIDIALIY
ncbi:hypothetical protein GCK32_012951, partial [Trichostrongylus colubriformis]